MGPTEVVPMSQYLSVDDQDWSCVNAAAHHLAPGCTSVRLTTDRPHQPIAVLAHHGTIHRACRRRGSETESAPWRPMMKFIFSNEHQKGGQHGAEPAWRPQRGSSIGGATDAAEVTPRPAWQHQPGSVRPFAKLSAEPDLVPAMEAQWEWLLRGGAGGSTCSELDQNAPPHPPDVVVALRASLMAAPQRADEARRVGAAYRLGRLGRGAPRGGTGAAALGALMLALQGEHEAVEARVAAQRVAAAGLAAAGEAAVLPLCELLHSCQDHLVLMYAADALADAAPPQQTGNDLAARALDAVDAAAQRLEAMAATSPRLAAWRRAEQQQQKKESSSTPAAAAHGLFARGTAAQRQQWEFAEDTALQACRTARGRIS
eukprot:COSAG01_NODE_11312_length_1961_cov_3.338883_2_plen_373_part_00